LGVLVEIPLLVERVKQVFLLLRVAMLPQIVVVVVVDMVDI
jgi:hypothetical protein